MKPKRKSIDVPLMPGVDELLLKLAMWVKRVGAHSAIIDVGADGRVAVSVTSSDGFTAHVTHADLIPGGPLPPPSVVITALFRAENLPLR